jgi:hypothetical protein
MGFTFPGLIGQKGVRSNWTFHKNIILPYNLSNIFNHTVSKIWLTLILFFVYFLRRARVRWPFLCLCRPFCISERCLDSNTESCRSKQVRYQLSRPSPPLSHSSRILYFTPRKLTFLSLHSNTPIPAPPLPHLPTTDTVHTHQARSFLFGFLILLQLSQLRQRIRPQYT